MSGNSGNPLDVVPITKPDLVVFFIIDRSSSMDGPRINSVNTAMRETIPILRSVGGSDANLKITVLTFSVGAQWLYSEPIAVEDFEWSELDVGGFTDFGAACNELCLKMSRNEYMASKVGYKKPIVILITDGAPTDPEVWPDALRMLKENKWFQFAMKFALAVEDVDAEGMKILEDFVGTSEGVYEINDTDKLKHLIKVIAVTSAEIGSKSMPIDISFSTGTTGETADDKDAERTYKEVNDAINEGDLVDDDDWV